MKFLLISAMVLSIACLVLAVFHWLQMRRDRKQTPNGVVTQKPMWLEFPRAYTRQGRHHQRRFFVYVVVFIVLLIVLFAVKGAGVLSS
jgi:F0F1-type ATP synthase membrane subunit a